MEVYLDNAASTRPYDEVAEYFKEVLLKYYANPSSLHRFASETKKLCDYTANEMLALLGLKERRVIFTSGATESANMAIKGIVEKLSDFSSNEIVTSTFEHPCVSKVFAYYEKKGIVAHYIPVNMYGQFDEEALLASINERTRLVSLIWVNNEIGAVNDVNALIKKIKAKNERVITHVDATQGFGKVALSLDQADMISVSAHKFHALKGVGALILKPGLVLAPQMLGGGHQDNFRSGTINAPAIAAMGKACEILRLNPKIDEMKAMQKYLYDNIAEAFGRDVINTAIYDSNFAPHIINVSFEGIKGEVLLHMLEESKIYISTASACSSNKTSGSALEALNFSKKRIEGTVRISLSDLSTMEELDYFTEHFVPAVKRLRDLVKK